MGGAVDLLAGGDHLAVLNFFHDGAHLAGGHCGCGRTRGAQGTSGWSPSPSPPPHRRVLSLSPFPLGQMGQALTFPGGL